MNPSYIADKKVMRKAQTKNVFRHLNDKGKLTISRYTIVTSWIRLLTGFVMTWAFWATCRVSHVEQAPLTLPDHIKSPSISWFSWFLVFSFLLCVFCTIVCLTNNLCPTLFSMPRFQLITRPAGYICAFGWCTKHTFFSRSTHNLK